MTGPAGFWCPKCGEYQSTMTKGQVKSARRHVEQCEGRKSWAERHNDIPSTDS